MSASRTKKPPRWKVEHYMHKRWHIVPYPFRGKKRNGYFVYRFGLVPGMSLVADIPPDHLNRAGRESLICGAFFEEMCHKESHGLRGTA